MSSAFGRGRSLILYLLPTVVLAIVLLAAAILMARYQTGIAASTAARQSAQATATALAAALSDAVGARGDLLQLALADGSAGAALAARDADAVGALERLLPQRMAGLLQLRLLPTDANQPDPSGPAPLGYAGLDMLRRTVQTLRPAAAEIHQIESGAPYLALTYPVVHDGKIAGVAFTAWDMRFLVRRVEQSPAFAGVLQLRQGDNGGYILARGPGGIDGEVPPDAVEIDDTIWTIRYGAAPGAAGSGQWLMSSALLGGGALLLILVAGWQWRSLARDLRVDMGVMVNLGESIKNGGGGMAATPQVASCADAIALLNQCARDAHGAGAPNVRAAAGLRARPAPALAEQQAPGLSVEELDGSDPAEMLGQVGARSDVADIPDNVFRAYDIRGIVGDAVTAEFAQLLGRALGTLVLEQDGQRIAVARDARLSSPQLATALVDGIVATGCNVLDIGQAPTPLLYFTMHNQPVQGGVIVTGSHNPAEYNGFKIVVGDSVLDGADLDALKTRMREGVFNQGNGSTEALDMSGEYLDAVAQEIQLTRPLKVVVDSGNGVAGDLSTAVFEQLGCEVIPLFCEADGNFPNHHPDPSQPANMTALMLEVQAQEADLGIAFDGDGDRIGLVDETGSVVFADSLLMLLAADVLGRHPGVDVLYDVKSSRHLASFVLGHGGRPIMWQSGHSRMRAKMIESGALLGGEFSGHIFIKERWYGFDDAIYAGSRILELLAVESRALSELLSDLPASAATPEYQLPLEEGRSNELMRSLDARQAFEDARLIEIDGLRVEFAEGWGLIRPSNTTPALTFRFEADDEGALERIKVRFRDLLARAAPDLKAPF